MNPSTKMSPGTANYNNSNAKPGQGADIGPAQGANPTVNVLTPAGKNARMGELGKSGTFIYSGIITNEEYNLELTRFEGIRRYEIMRRSDSTIAAMLDAVKLPIEATNWHINPANEDQQQIEAADFIRQELFGRKINFPQLLQDAGLMLDFGYSVMEKVLGYTTFSPEPRKGKDGEDTTPGEKRLMIGLDKLAFRKHRSIYKWETSADPTNGIEAGQPGITQYVPGGTYSIPMDKLCVFTFHKEGDNWEGIPLLRRVYKDWDIKDKLILINAIRHERQGLGIIQVVAPEGANQDDIDRVIANARAARASEEAVFQNEEGYVVEFMDMKAGTGQLTNIIETIEYHDKQIMLAVLAQFIMLGQRSSGSSGSRATSEDQSRLFELGLESVARNIQSTIQESIIKPLCDMNFSNLDGKYPKLEFDKIGDENIKTIGDTVSTLLQANGLTMDPDLEQALRTLLHLPDLPDDYREDWANRLELSGGQPVPPVVDANNPLGSNKPLAAGPKGNPDKQNTAKKKIDPKAQGNTKLTATDTDALTLLRQARETALELLAHERSNED